MRHLASNAMTLRCFSCGGLQAGDLTIVHAPEKAAWITAVHFEEFLAHRPGFFLRWSSLLL